MFEVSKEIIGMVKADICRTAPESLISDGILFGSTRRLFFPPCDIRLFFFSQILFPRSIKKHRPEGNCKIPVPRYTEMALSADQRHGWRLTEDINCNYFRN